MASTVTIDAQPAGRVTSGNTRMRRGTINLGVYATGGVAITAAQFELYVAMEDLDIAPSGGYVFEYLPATLKVKAYDQKDPAAAGGADIPLPEVGNAVDISAIVTRFVATGR